MPTLEELIHLPRFQTEKQKSIVIIYYINSLVVKHFEQILSRYGLTFQQFNTLRIIRGQYPKAASVNLVKERLLDRNSDASRLIARLVEAGLVTRTVNKKDRRVSDVMITEKALGILNDLDPMEATFQSVANGLDEQELLELNRLLQKYLDHLMN